jgi:hypothetical protein
MIKEVLRRPSEPAGETGHLGTMSLPAVSRQTEKAQFRLG